jgi:hypothetical protein
MEPSQGRPIISIATGGGGTHNFTSRPALLIPGTDHDHFDALQDDEQRFIGGMSRNVLGSGGGGVGGGGLASSDLNIRPSFLSVHPAFPNDRGYGGIGLFQGSSSSSYIEAVGGNTLDRGYQEGGFYHPQQHQHHQQQNHPLHHQQQRDGNERIGLAPSQLSSSSNSSFHHAFSKPLGSLSSDIRFGGGFGGGIGLGGGLGSGGLGGGLGGGLHSGQDDGAFPSGRSISPSVGIQLNIPTSSYVYNQQQQQQKQSLSSSYTMPSIYKGLRMSLSRDQSGPNSNIEAEDAFALTIPADAPVPAPAPLSSSVPAPALPPTPLLAPQIPSTIDHLSFDV